jgi:hypothetical protein
MSYLIKLEDRRRVTASRAAVRSRVGVTAISQDFQYNTAAPHRCTSQTLLLETILPNYFKDICDRILRHHQFSNYVTKDKTGQHGEESRGLEREHQK